MSIEVVSRTVPSKPRNGDYAGVGSSGAAGFADGGAAALLARFNDYFSFDKENGAIVANHSFYSVGGIAALGAGPNVAGGGGVSTFAELLDVQFSGLSAGNIASWDGSHWVNVANPLTVINTEIERATKEESRLSNLINADSIRISAFSTSLADEIKRATEKDAALLTSISNEIKRATDEDARLVGLINADSTKLSALTASFNAEVTRSANEDTAIRDALTTEITRSTNADNSLSAALSAEVNRATSIESGLNSTLNSLLSKFNEYFSWDAANQSIKVNYNLYSVGGIAAMGAGPAVSGGGGGASLLSDLLDCGISNPSAMQALVYDGQKWRNGRINASMIDGLKVTTAWGDILNKPNSLAGYGITDQIWTANNFNPATKLDVSAGRILNGGIGIVQGIDGIPQWNNYSLSIMSAGANKATLNFHRPGFSQQNIWHQEAGFLDVDCNFRFNGNSFWHAGNFNPTTKSDVGHTHSSIAITDNRGADRLPTDYNQFQLSTFFNESIQNPHYSGWASGITMRGWTNGYQSWQLFSDSNDGTNSNDLFFRTGVSSWNQVVKLWHSGNLNNAITPINSSNLVIGDGNGGSTSVVGIGSYLRRDTKPRAVFNWGPAGWWGLGEHTTGGYNLRMGATTGGLAAEWSNTAGQEIDLYLGATRKVWHTDNFNPNGLEQYTSGRDFPSGTLILTNVAFNKDFAFLLEIKSNTYFNLSPFTMTIQGYIFKEAADTNWRIISQKGTALGSAPTNVLALNLDGKLAFWFGRQGYWCGYTAKLINVGDAGYNENRVINIVDSVEPASSYKVNIDIDRGWHSGNANSSAFDWNARNLISESCVSKEFSMGELAMHYGNEINNTKGNKLYIGYRTTSEIQFGMNKLSINPLTGSLFAEDRIGGKKGIGANNCNVDGTGISLWGIEDTVNPAYGLFFATTANFGKYGGVASDFATYFTMSGDSSRGWVYRHNGVNVASINGAGDIFARRMMGTGVANDYANGGLETRGSGSDNLAFPLIGFHQPGLYAGAIRCTAWGELESWNDSINDYGNFRAKALRIGGYAITETDGGLCICKDGAIIAKITTQGLIVNGGVSATN